MSIELEQLRKVAHQTDIGYLRDDGTVETISLSAILARMQALENAVASVAAIRSRFSSTPMMNGTVQFTGFHKGMLGGSIINDELTAMNHAFAAISKP